MPWDAIKPTLNDVGLSTFVKCWVCTTIDMKNKVIMIKWDSIEKHAKKRENLNGKWYMDPKCGHAKNEITNAQLSTTIVLWQLDLGQVVEDKQKLV
jgi:hypothetical protein